MPASSEFSFAPAGGEDGFALRANRLGRLTRAQRRAVRRFRRGRMGRALVRTTFLGGAVVLVSRAGGTPLRDVRLAALALLTLALLSTLGRAYVLWHVVEGDLAAGQVREMDGEFVHQDAARITFRVWERRTRLTPVAAPDTPLRRGAIYRVYLLPRSGLLLGVEARYDKA